MAEQTPTAAQAPAPPVPGTAPEGTPPEQPEGETPGQATTGTPPPQVNVRELHQGFTQKSQQNADMRKGLGLPPTASHEQVMGRIAELNQANANLDPEVEARMSELDEREWTLADQTYGQAVSGGARALRESVSANSSPMALTGAVYELATEIAAQMVVARDQQQQQQPQEQGAPQGQPAQAAQQQQPPDGADIPMGSSDAGPLRAQLDEAETPGSGDTRGFFQRMLRPAK